MVVEEFLTGKEVSVLAFTDSHTISPMISSMDHKRVYDNDEGPNTGGMGTIAPSPYYTPEVAKRCMEEIFSSYDGSHGKKRDALLKAVCILV